MIGTTSIPFLRSLALRSRVLVLGSKEAEEAEAEQNLEIAFI